MIKMKCEQISDLLFKILLAAGTPEDIAKCVSASLVDSSLKGVDSHGIFRISSYVNQIAEGYLKPDARPEIERETSTTAIIRGHLGFGIYALRYALDIAICKSKDSGVAGVGLYETTHTGRLGWFVEQAAKQNVIAILTGGGGNRHEKHKSVAPYGGLKRIFATNPYTIGSPGGRFGTVVVDFSTSMTPVGKIQFAKEANLQLPPGLILDNEGRPSTDPHDFYNGGVILPMAGHKGYGLALIAELLTDALLGVSYELNWFVIAIDIEKFRPIEEFTQASEEILQKIKEIPPTVGLEEVMFPGEPEARTAKKRSVDGIPIPDEIWQGIKKTAIKLGLDL